MHHILVIKCVNDAHYIVNKTVYLFKLMLYYIRPFFKYMIQSSLCTLVHTGDKWVGCRADKKLLGNNSSGKAHTEIVICLFIGYQTWQPHVEILQRETIKVCNNNEVFLRNILLGDLFLVRWLHMNVWNEIQSKFYFMELFESI